MLPSIRRMKVVYHSSDMPESHSPYLICGFPGSGYVGKLAIDHLIQRLNANHLAVIYSSPFPPQIVIRSNGVAELMKNTYFLFKGSFSSSNNDLLLLTGDSEPENPDSEYLLAEKNLSIADKFNTKKVFTMGTYVTGVFVDNPRNIWNSN